MASLYDINQEMLNCIDEETGEIIDIEKLSELQMEKESKIESVALWYKNLLSDAEQYKKEKEIFAERERVAKKKAESLKGYLENSLCGDAFKTTKVNISYRKSESVVVDDLFSVNENYLTYDLPKVDKAAIKKALKDGEEINGVHIEVKNNIQIK